MALDQEADRLAEDRADFVENLGEFDRVGAFRSAVADIEATPEPHLTFIHSVFPHVPWSRHADGSAYPDPGNPGLDDNVWSGHRRRRTSLCNATSCRPSSPTSCWAS